MLLPQTRVHFPASRAVPRVTSALPHNTPLHMGATVRLHTSHRLPTTNILLCQIGCCPPFLFDSR